jgi:hypothetical protein
MPRLASIVVLLATAACAAIAGPSLAAAPPCPPSLPTLGARGPAQTVLVPTGARSLLLCSYRGLDPPGQAHQLERQRAVGAGPALNGLVREFDNLPARSGLTSCPMDNGSAILALFGYAVLPTDEVSVGLSGCQVVTNGRVTRTASLGPGPALVAELSRLVG